jgi:hypothetical protein
VLHAVRQRSGHDSDAQNSLLVVRIPKFPSDRVRILADMARMIPPDPKHPTRWAVISELGGYLIHLDGIVEDSMEGSDRPVLSGSSMTAAAIEMMRDPMRSDLTLTVLKVLLAQRSHQPQIWFGPSYIAPCTQRELAGHLEVSASSLHQAITTLRGRGWLDARRGGILTLTNPAAVVGWWLDHAKNNPARRIGLRSVFSATTSDRWTWLKSRPWVADVTWAVNGWSAIALKDEAILNDPEAKPLSLVMQGSFQSLLKSWELVPCSSPDDPRLIIMVEATHTPRSTFIGARTRHGLPCVDHFQAALDVIGDPNRGIEQAVAMADSLFLGRT